MLRSRIVITLIANSALMALGLANSILLSRWLGAAGRGEVAAAMLWPTLLVYLSSVGLISATLYFAALGGSEPGTIFANTTVLAVGQSAAALIIGFVALPLLLRSQASNVISAGRLYLLVVPLSLLTQYGGSILQGRMQISTFNVLRSIVPAGYLIGTMVLVVTGRLGVFEIIILHLILNAVTLAATLLVLAGSGVRLGLGFDSDLAKRMLKYGSKVQVGNVSGLANLSLDQVLMAALLPPAFLGLYVAAVGSAGVSQVFSHAVQMVSIPSIARRESGSERAAVLQEVFRRYWFFSFLITLTIATLLPVAIPLVFGPSFKDAVWPAEVLLLGTFFLGAQVVLAGGAQALGNPWLASKSNLGALIVTVVLLYALLRPMGIMGAAIATAGAYFTQFIIVVCGLLYSHHISPASFFRIKLTDLRSVLNMFHRGQGRHWISDQR